MKLPSLSEIQIAEWPGHTFQQWIDVTEQVRVEGSGTQSTRFYKRVDEIKAWVRDGGSAKEFISFLEDRLTLRAMTWLWLNDELMRSRLLRTEVINYLAKKVSWLGRLVTIQLMGLYLKFYDQLENFGQHSEGLLHALKELLKKQLEYFSGSSKNRNQTKIKNLFDAFSDHKNILLADNAVFKTVSYATSRNLDLQDLFDQLGLKGFDNGHFAEQCRYIFYIKKVESLAEGEWDPVLLEVQRKVVANAAYDGQQLLGHVAMQLLIDKVTTAPTDEWLEVLIEIAGDPRISNTAPNFRKWWQPLGEKRVSRVRRWLAKEDLRLFLEAVQQYSFISNDDSLRRMFPARKKFLEGVFEQGLVRDARLILGSKAADFIDKNTSKENKIKYMNLAGKPDTAVIYLDCGDFYLIEGSHNFKIWLYLAKPTELFDSYIIRDSLKSNDITTNMSAEYERKYPRLPYKSITHSETTWRKHVIEFLYSNGIKIDLEKVMDKTDYNYYVENHGYPVLGRKRYS